MTDAVTLTGDEVIKEIWKKAVLRQNSWHETNQKADPTKTDLQINFMGVAGEISTCDLFQVSHDMVATDKPDDGVDLEVKGLRFSIKATGTPGIIFTDKQFEEKKFLKCDYIIPWNYKSNITWSASEKQPTGAAKIEMICLGYATPEFYIDNAKPWWNKRQNKYSGMFLDGRYLYDISILKDLMK